MPNVLAIAEQKDGSLRRVSREAATAAAALAAELGGEAHALLLGPEGAGQEAAGLGANGVSRVFVAAHSAFSGYAPAARTAAVGQFLEGRDYFAVLLPATGAGRDLAPRLAARLGVPLASEATALEVADGELTVTRPIYAGKAFAKVRLGGAPRLVTLRPNVFTPREVGGAAEVERIAPSGLPEERVRVRELKAGDTGAVDVAEATVVVSGGRGMQDPSNWHVLEDLRDALGDNAALGASRAVVDAGWRPHAEQVGQTGKTVSPQLYFAVAISGAIQHLAGMRTASTIVAVNKDPDAPIFKVADYGIVGDALAVVPRLAEEVRKARQG